MDSAQLFLYKSGFANVQAPFGYSSQVVPNWEIIIVKQENVCFMRFGWF